ncbi:MAG: DUF5696 domain-containing protein [Planctomycetota bacterium]
MESYVLRNDQVHLEVNPGNLTFRAKHIPTDTTWYEDPWDTAAGELTLRSEEGDIATANISKGKYMEVFQQGQSLLLSYRGFNTWRGYLPTAQVQVRLQLHEQGAGFDVIIESVKLPSKWSFESLTYPVRFGALRTHVDEGYLVLPTQGGALIPTHMVPLSGSDFWLWDDEFFSPDRGENATGPYGDIMPWAGMQMGNTGLMAVLGTPYDGVFKRVINYNRQGAFNAKRERTPYPQIAAISPHWLSARGEFGYPRAVSYYLLYPGTYVQMAQAYRHIARAQGLLKTWDERIAENPNVERLIGAPAFCIYGGYPHYVNYEPLQFTWDDVSKIVNDMRNDLKIERARVTVWGGFSKLPYKSYPWDERKGPIEKLKELVNLANGAGYVFGFYQNWSPMLEQEEYWDLNLLICDSKGVVPSGRWGRVCPSQYLTLCKEAMGPILQDVKLESIFVDCTTPPPPRECYHPAHPLSREQDIKDRVQLFEYLRSLKLIVGSEAFKAWAAGACDYLENTSTQIHQPMYFKNHRVPLINLVFHGATELYAHANRGYTFMKDEPFPVKFLMDLAYAQPPVVTCSLYEYPAVRPFLRLGEEIVGKFCRAVGKKQMTNHELLGPDMRVHRTTFEDVRIIVNTSLMEFKDDQGRVLPPLSYIVEGVDGIPARGSFKQFCHIEPF